MTHKTTTVKLRFTMLSRDFSNRQVPIYATLLRDRKMLIVTSIRIQWQDDLTLLIVDVCMTTNTCFVRRRSDQTNSTDLATCLQARSQYFVPTIQYADGRQQMYVTIECALRRYARHAAKHIMNLIHLHLPHGLTCTEFSAFAAIHGWFLCEWAWSVTPIRTLILTKPTRSLAGQCTQKCDLL